MKTTVNNNNIESKNGMSQVINILTGETKKIRCHYLSKRTDKPVSRVLTLERLSHPALTAAGVTAWAERFNDGVNRFDWIRVSIQLTDSLCYTPNCANVGLLEVKNYGNLDYYKGHEGMMRVSMNNVDKFFQRIADKPAKMMTGEDWPNTAVIAAYRAAGRDQEADTLTTARDIYNARREADKEAWRKKYDAQQYYYNSPKPKNFDDMTELERAQFMMQTAQECAKEHPELDWADILERAEKRLEKAKKAEAETKELQKAEEIAAAEGIEVGSFVKINTDGRTAIVKGIGLVSEGHGVMLYLDDFTNWCKDCREENGYNIIMTSDEVTPLTEDDYKPQTDIKDDYKVGDRVRHNQSGRVATIEGVRVTREMKAYGEYRKVYRLNFGEAMPGPFGYDLNGGEFLAEAITPYKTA